MRHAGAYFNEIKIQTFNTLNAFEKIGCKISANLSRSQSAMVIIQRKNMTMERDIEKSFNSTIIGVSNNVSFWALFITSQSYTPGKTSVSFDSNF